ncbi:MAG: sensor histidine kinase [Thermoleophilia bacterium]
MADKHPISAILIGMPARAATCLRAGIDSPSLIGPGGTATRFTNIQWFVILWRSLVLVELVIMIFACTACFFVVGDVLIILAIGVVHVLVFSWLRLRTTCTISWPFYVADFAVCLGMILLSRNDGTLITLMAMYAPTALFVRPTLRISQTIALSGLMSVTFLYALSFTAPGEDTMAPPANYALIFIIWGLGSMLVYRLIDRAARLEVDNYLTTQRCGFKRRLHDDLGNTVCGLHFKIQSLVRMEKQDMERTLAALEAGYDRAGAALNRLLTGMDDETGCDSLEELARTAERDFNIRVHLTGNTLFTGNSPAFRLEVFSLLQEAVTNSAKHASTDEVTISLARSRKRLEITVSDQGVGFETPFPDGNQRDASNGRKTASGHKDGYGLEIMKERAAVLGAGLTIISQPGAGTTVTLSLKENAIRADPGRGITNRLLDSNTYLMTVRMKLVVALLEIVQLFVGGLASLTDPAALLITFLVAVEAVTWYLFRDRLFSLLTRRPWWLVPDVLFFCLFYFISWRQGIPLVAAEATTMAIVMSAWFLGPAKNLVMTLILGAGIVAASLLAPAETNMGTIRTEQLFSEVMDNIILGVLAGFAFRFINGINARRTEVVDTALERSRAMISSATNRGLYEMLRSLQGDISILKNNHGREATGLDHENFITSLETQSNLLKKRLRDILRAIDGPDAEMTALAQDDTVLQDE